MKTSFPMYSYFIDTSKDFDDNSIISKPNVIFYELCVNFIGIDPEVIRKRMQKIGDGEYIVYSSDHRVHYNHNNRKLVIEHKEIQYEMGEYYEEWNTYEQYVSFDLHVNVNGITIMSVQKDYEELIDREVYSLDEYHKVRLG